MRLWLTLDSLWTYLIDGVPGCGVWISKPRLDSEKGWSAEHQPLDCIRAGKSILSHPDVVRIDNEIMQYFVPGIDLRLPRWKRFSIVRESRSQSDGCSRPQLIMTYEVSPAEWARTMMKVAEPDLADARWAQKIFDPNIPF